MRVAQDLKKGDKGWVLYDSRPKEVVVTNIEDISYHGTANYIFNAKDLNGGNIYSPENKNYSEKFHYLYNEEEVILEYIKGLRNRASRLEKDKKELEYKISRIYDELDNINPYIKVLNE